MGDTGYAQVSVVGTAGGQTFTNILYYGLADGEEAFLEVATLGALLAEFGESVLTAWLDAEPEVYTLLQLEARVVNVRGVVISDNPVVLGVAEPGTRVQTINGPWQTAILRFPTVRAESFDARALKRSYIAFGPLGSTTMEVTGELVSLAKSYLLDVAEALAAPLTVGLDLFYPVRVGRTVSPELPAIGVVTQGLVDPFGSFRKSRKRRANGT